jgi:type II secretion system protein C
MRFQPADLKRKIEDFRKKGKEATVALAVELLSKSLLILFAAYFCASIASSLMLPFFGGSALSHKAKPKLDFVPPRTAKLTNYRDLRKAVLARNVFNNTGEVPDEPDPTEGGTGNAFNPEDKCAKSSLNIELLGIIDTGDPLTSLATIQEKGYTIADIYKAEDRIIGNEQALVYAIEATKVVLNNNGVKECLDLNSVRSPQVAASTSSPGASPAPGSTSSEAGDSGEGGQCPSGTVSMEAAYVEESLGPGFSKILEAGRLVPFHRDNQMVGFKLIGVKGGTIWSRANLNSGDVITAVNGQSMAQPEKGFAVYESLQADKQIRVEFLKSGKSPCSLNIEIK